jgi:hypothetical protein
MVQKQHKKMLTLDSCSRTLPATNFTSVERIRIFRWISRWRSLCIGAASSRMNSTTPFSNSSSEDGSNFRHNPRRTSYCDSSRSADLSNHLTFSFRPLSITATRHLHPDYYLLACRRMLEGICSFYSILHPPNLRIKPLKPPHERHFSC